MINTIILDIGNVLVRFRWEEYLKECGYDTETIRKIGDATVRSDLWTEWDRGAREEEELIALCCEKDPSVVSEITSFFDNFGEWVREYDYSVEFIRKLRANDYKVYLLSNYSKNSFRYLMDHFKFYNHVDGGVISYEVNYIKPEPEIYQALLDKYNINPKEAVFLDDIPANLEGASHFGIHTILFHEFDVAMEELRALGVRI
jgi:putative hydrolase of the HAD superfamily